MPNRLAPSRVTTIGVNSYLWRAALDTVSFAPLLQADQNSGVIITDWYANPRAPGERVKLTVTILDQDLRADALRVSASREVNQNGAWVRTDYTLRQKLHRPAAGRERGGQANLRCHGSGLRR